MKKGKLIALEGIDGAGTTTQSWLLVQALKRRDISALGTWEPTGGPIGLLIRKFLRREIKPCSPEAMALLFAADRADHSDDLIKAAIRADNVVVCDRYVWSSIAYQSVVLDDLDWVLRINARAEMPDLVVYVRVSPEVAKERRVARDNRQDLYDDDKIQVAVAKSYDDMAKSGMCGCQVLVVDGEQNEDQVYSDILFGVEQFLGITSEWRKKL